MMDASCSYYRVSTEHQDLQRQKDIVHEYCTNNSIVLDEEFEDKITGVSLERPGLTKLKEWITTHNGGTVYLASLDRATRDMGLYMDLYSICKINQVTLHCVNSPKTGDAKIDHLMEEILVSFAEWERSVISSRLTSGKLTKLKAGVPIVSRVPYGYFYRRQIDGGAQISINEEEAMVVREIFKKYASGKFSMRKLCQELNNKGIKPQQKSSFGWQRSTLRGILTCPAYIGKLYYLKNKVTGRGRQVTKRPKGEQIQLSCPPIVTKNLFNTAQKMVEKNLIHNPRNKKFDYLLSGIIRCSSCGKKYSAWTSSYGGRFARCSSRDILKKDRTHMVCHNRAVKLEPLEKYIWEMTKFFLKNPDLVRKHFKEISGVSKRTLQDLVERNKSIQSKINNLEGKRKEVFSLFSQDIISASELKEHKESQKQLKESLEKEQKENTIEIAKLKEMLTVNEDQLKLKMLYQILNDKAFETLSFKEKVDAVRSYIKEIIVLPEKFKYTVIFTLPMSAVPKGKRAEIYKEPVDSAILSYKGVRSYAHGASVTWTRLPITLNDHVDIRIPYSLQFLQIPVVSKDDDRHYQRWQHPIE